MISKECFVYIQLPGRHDLVTAGRFEWEKTGTGRATGRFVYGKKFLENKRKIALDEFSLPLEEKVFECIINEGVFGPIRDASPDKWGRYVIEKNTPRDQWDEIGYLINGAEDRVGALSFGMGKIPPAPIRNYNQTVDLNDLITAAHKLEQDQPISETEKNILLAGASMGGARPKTTVEKDKELWLAKFPSHNDRYNFAKIEFGTMKLAKECGLKIPDIDLLQIGGKDVFLVKRFDREWDESSSSYLKHHFISGLTALNLDEADIPKWSYLDLADQLRRRVKKPESCLKELYKRIIFNSLISNSDDHPRNHGLLYSSNGYQLSQVYDLVPQPVASVTRYSAMAIGAEGRVYSKKNILSRCDAFGLADNEAKNLYEQMKSKIKNWRRYFTEIKLSSEDFKYLEPAFSWEGQYLATD